MPLTLVAPGTSKVACPRCGAVLPHSRLRIHLTSKRCEDASRAAAAPAAVLDADGAEVGEGEGAEEGGAAWRAPIAELGDAQTLASGKMLCPQPGCGHQSPNLKALRKHWNGKHGEHRHECFKCKKTFGRSDLLSRHRKVCGQPKQFACSCDPEKKYSTLFNLTRHMGGKEGCFPVFPQHGDQLEYDGGAAQAAADGNGVEEDEAMVFDGGADADAEHDQPVM